MGDKDNQGNKLAKEDHDHKETKALLAIKDENHFDFNTFITHFRLTKNHFFEAYHSSSDRDKAFLRGFLLGGVTAYILKNRIGMSFTFGMGLVVGFYNKQLIPYFKKLSNAINKNLKDNGGESTQNKH